MSAFPPWLLPRPNGCELRLHVVPRSTRTLVDGTHGERLKVRLHAPPVDGKANEALRKHFAKTLGCAPSAVLLLHGESGREKTVFLPLPAETVAAILGGT